MRALRIILISLLITAAMSSCDDDQALDADPYHEVTR